MNKEENIKQEQYNIDAANVLSKLVNPLGLTFDDVGGSVNIHGADPVFPSSVRMGAAFAIAAMAAAMGPAAIWRARTGKSQNLTIDIRKAAYGISPDVTFAGVGANPRKVSLATIRIGPTEAALQ